MPWQYLTCGLFVCSTPVWPSAVMMPSYGFGRHVRLLLVAAAVESTPVVSATSSMSGIACLIFSTNCFDDTSSPTRISAFDALGLPALDEAVELLLRRRRCRRRRDRELASVPRSTPIACERGHDDRRSTRGLAVDSASDRDLLAVERVLRLQQRHDHAQPAVGRDVGRDEQSPGGASVDELLGERVDDRSASCASWRSRAARRPLGRRTCRSTANTCSSSVSDVHAVSSSVLLSGQYVL